uniref:Uncharacterized protein n=1 Tax=Anguilla anguilla TaxID=7936 RepID=A0A0E9VEJ0_ANGAN
MNMSLLVFSAHMILFLEVNAYCFRCFDFTSRRAFCHTNKQELWNAPHMFCHTRSY